MLLTIKNSIKWWYQRRTRGFDDRELWSLDYPIARFILPRLVSFRKTAEKSACVPGCFCNCKDDRVEPDLGAWLKELDNMIFAFQAIVRETEDYSSSDVDIDFNRELNLRVGMGLDSFARYFRCLWT